MLDDATKTRLTELMFYVVPDPEEVLSDEMLEQSEAVGWEEAEQLKAEFRNIVESAVPDEDVRRTVLESLDAMAASGDEAHGDDVEWMNVRDVMGRRIRWAMAQVIDG